VRRENCSGRPFRCVDEREADARSDREADDKNYPPLFDRENSRLRRSLRKPTARVSRRGSRPARDDEQERLPSSTRNAVGFGVAGGPSVLGCNLDRVRSRRPLSMESPRSASRGTGSVDARNSLRNSLPRSRRTIRPVSIATRAASRIAVGIERRRIERRSSRGSVLASDRFDRALCRPFPRAICENTVRLAACSMRIRKGS
jgi:hypothetical protein